MDRFKDLIEEDLNTVSEENAGFEDASTDVAVHSANRAIDAVIDTTAVILAVAAGSKKRTSIMNKNVIDLTCVVDEESRHEAGAFCKAVEYQIATLISSLVRTDNTLGSREKNIFKALPLLSRYDKLYMDKSTNQFSSVDKFMQSVNASSNDATATFYEAYMAALAEMDIATEGKDVKSNSDIVDDGGLVGPTFIDIPVKYLSIASRKDDDSTMRLGIRVTPKVVHSEEFIQMFKKGITSDIVVNEKGMGLLNKVKRACSSMMAVFKRNKNVQQNMPKAEAKTLYAMMTRVKSIQKPFVLFFMSKETADTIRDTVKVDVTKGSVLQAMYDRYPLLGIGILSPDNTVQASFDRTAALSTYDLKDLKILSKATYNKIVENESKNARM